LIRALQIVSELEGITLLQSPNCLSTPSYTNPGFTGVYELGYSHYVTQNMKPSEQEDSGHNTPVKGWLWLAVLGLLVITVALVLRPQWLETSPPTATVANNSASPPSGDPSSDTRRSYLPRGIAGPANASAEIVVAEKVVCFARSREELVAAMAKEFQVGVPEEVNRFFAAVQAKDWAAITNQFAALQAYRQSTNRPPGLEKLWPAIQETYGVAEAAHQWPAQQLLDYGQAILGALRPGMVYVGGTDAGRFIPTLLNETGEGQPHILLTQNGLADQTYLDYLRFRYADQLATLSPTDSQEGFQRYLTDAQKRLQHDQTNPDGTRQIRPGEDIRVTEGRVHVAGQVAVMAINEQLLRTLMEKNPGLSFALEESFPLKSFYAEASVLGPVMELRAGANTAPLSAQTASQAVDYWRNATQAVADGADTTAASRDAYTKLILGQANLFFDRQLSSQAEQAYQLANQLSPANPDGVFSYVNLLAGQNRFTEARQVVQTALNLEPDNKQSRELMIKYESKGKISRKLTKLARGERLPGWPSRWLNVANNFYLSSGF